ncbi:hypothetical protein SAMD00019534_068860 [Acytostelium subglobosum LB1]|uniref:hypothetical protein n=1 Tax=Acytostelium subglobosum LB1 TaxID=1410327 RepID=UPI000644A378|nr:hypothetical protein SAMD00019534_068860 [Acytostelium subglobosum LB1]GAM23711.1 hypothetical protein SAMD00019534_068860 [Acytostelium subglobosum LB1]|eukprot:XP_012753452.1 hypothetical protein SAMD00019534_068860 [Acytostelium subglobosum LB1]
MTCKRLLAEIHNKRQLQLKTLPYKGISGVTLLENSDVKMFYNVEDIPWNLPPTVTHLELGPKFKMPFELYLPPSLTSLKVNSSKGHHCLLFDQLPTSIKTLELGDHFKTYSEVSNGRIPTTITSLSLGNVFNQDLLPSLLPSSLISLTLGDRFDQRIGERSLPLTLESLMFGKDYNHEFGLGVLPSSLTSLSFHEYSLYDKEFMPRVLPNQLQSLTLGEHYNQMFRVGSLPQSISYLYFSSMIPAYNQEFKPGVLPASLETLIILGQTFKQSIKRDVLPNSLTRLMIPMNAGHVFEQGALPNSLTCLTLSAKPVITLGMLPSSLQSLFISDDFNGVIPVGALPESLTKLSFEGCTRTQTHPFTPGMLPSSLKTLVMTNSIVQMFKQNTLPASLTALKLYKLTSPIQPGVLPSTITALDLSDFYSFALTTDELPPALKMLKVGGSSVTFPRLELLEIGSLDPITSINCDYVKELMVDNNFDSKKTNNAWPSTKQHFGSFTIGSRSYSSTIDPKHRVKHIKSLIRSIPNSNSYNIHCKGWSVQLRKTDPWNTIILMSKYDGGGCPGADEQQPITKKRIMFFTLDKSGKLVATLEDEINRLKQENDRLNTTYTKLIEDAKMKELGINSDDGVNNRLKQENDQLKCKVERLDQEKNEQSKKIEAVNNQLNQYFKEWEINVVPASVTPPPSKPVVAKSTRRRK